MSELRPFFQQPLVLVGPGGSGKTRLLNRVARRVREAHAEALFVCVSPHHFAPEVRELIHAPEALSRVEKAVLFVDALERFEEGTADLEALAGLFVRAGHAVVMTSRVHPWCLENITEGLRLLIARGRTAELPRQDGKNASVSGRDSGAQAHVASLLEAVRRQAAVASLAARRLRGTLGTHYGRGREASERIAQARQAHAEARQWLSSLRSALARTRAALERQTATAPDKDLGAEPPSTQVAKRMLRELGRARAEHARALRMVDALSARAEEILGGLSGHGMRLDELERWQRRDRLELDNLAEHRRAAAAEASAVRALAGPLEAALVRAESDRAALRAHLERALDQAESRIRVRGRARGLAQRVARLEAEKAVQATAARNMLSRLEASYTETVRARAELAGLVEQNEALMVHLESARVQMKKMEARMREQTVEAEELRRARDVAEGRAAAAGDLAARLQERAKRVAKERNVLRARLQSVLADRAAVLRQLALVRADHAAMGESALEAQDAAETLRADLAEAKSARWELEAELLAARRDEARRKRLNESVPGPERVAQDPGILPFAPALERRRLGEMLCATGRITATQLEEALAAQTETHGARVGDILVDKGYVSEDTVVEAVAGQEGVAFVRFDGATLAPEAVHLLDGARARAHRCIPLARSGDELTVAVADPLDRDAIAMATESTRLRIKVVAAPRSDIERAQASHYAA